MVLVCQVLCPIKEWESGSETLGTWTELLNVFGVKGTKSDFS